jgi:predicted Zn finger-like uncharacterized protein
MMLATRCPACSTSFRVLQDQLKASDGLVRCGRCNEVFNATLALFDAGLEAQPGAALSEPVPAALPERPVQADSPGDTLPAPGTDEPAAPATPVAEAEAEPEAADPVLQPAAVEPGEATHVQATAPLEPVEAAPTFLREARRAAGRSSPRERRLLTAAAAVLGFTLAAQAALLYRDELAAKTPASRPLLGALCALAGCKVEPPRRISALVVDASGLTQADDSTLYRLNLVLRNRAEVELMLPAFDLVLTDTLGRTVARRVLTAGELGNLSRSVPAGGELALLASLDTGEQRVAGYTIELFYP